MGEAIEVSIPRIQEVIDSISDTEFSTADVLRGIQVAFTPI